MENDELTRRDFVTTVTAGMIAAAGADLAAQQQVTETNVEIKTPDGTCDAAFIHPATGAHPAVIIWPDAFGLRPSMRNMAKRLAAEGYSVLVPNPFYRVAKAPIWEDASKVNFQEVRPKLTPLMGSIQADGAVEKDAPALIAWLDTQKQVDRNKKIGTQGYCMGGGLVVRTAAAVPNRVGAGASFHGGGLVTANANSPHLLAPKIKGRMYFGIATQDEAEGSVRCRQGAGRSRGLLDGAARLVRARHARAGERSAYLQEGRRRERVDETAGVVQGRLGLERGTSLRLTERL
jgi:carboxymethylenebutenolidase